MSTATLEQLRAETTRQVDAVLDDPEARLRLRASFYERAGTTDEHGRSELDFMRWEIARGVLAPMRAAKPGSPWWRAVNAAVLFHGALALACETHGIDLAELDLPTAQWVRYLRERTNAAWWRAHNASILTGYLEGVELARRETWAEQRFMNVVLYRILFAEAMIEGASDGLGALGRVLANPALPTVAFFAHEAELYPTVYPLDAEARAVLFHRTHDVVELGGEALDEGFILPHLTELYAQAAGWTGVADATRLCRDGRPVYPELDPPVRRKIAVLGGGLGGISAALALTDPANPASRRVEVTVYQMGWRIGGKGASGRNADANWRIQEHGLHIWFGFYNNAFAMLRGAYEELARAPDLPVADLNDAFEPHQYVVASSLKGAPARSLGQSLPVSLVPPGSQECEPPWVYLAEAIEMLVKQVFPTEQPSASPKGVPAGAANLAKPPGALDWLGGQLDHALLDLTLDALRDVTVLRPLVRAGDHLVARVLEALITAFYAQVKGDLDDCDTRYRWISANFLYANAAGSLRDDVLTRGFDSLNDVDYHDWIGRHCFDDGGLTRDSALVRTVYDGCFAYLDGDNQVKDGKPWPQKANMEAGVALRCAMLLAVTYKGAPVWKMTAGMGDIVFGPAYEVLRRRGVRFEFFHRVEKLTLSEDRRRVEGVHVATQATLAEGVEVYEPLVDVKGVPSWPSAPRYEQLAQGDALRAQGVDLEAWITDWAPVHRRELRRGVDFDDVILGLPIGTHPYLCQELIDASPAWRASSTNLRTTRTQGSQLWLSRTAHQLGWVAMGRPVMTGDETTELDTWADMTHLIHREGWTVERFPLQLSYFVGNLRDEVPLEVTPWGPVSPPETLDQRAADEIVLRTTEERLLDDLRGVFPHALKKGPDGPQFRWELLVAPAHHVDRDRLRWQHFRGNVQPHERYTLSAVGTSRHRLAAYDPDGFQNLYLAGDWTDCGLNVGCVEATVVSGLLASYALTGSPTPRHIWGLDITAGARLREKMNDWRATQGPLWPTPVPQPPPRDLATALEDAVQDLVAPLVERVSVVPPIDDGQGGWLMYQTWSDLLFLSWPVDPKALRPFVPASLELDLRDNQAWVSVIAFQMSDVRFFGAVSVPGTGDFPELNLRTYVRWKGTPGVYFIAINADALLASAVARTLFQMPYLEAETTLRREGDALTFEMVQRRAEVAEAVSFRAEWTLEGDPFVAVPGSLEDFLTERYALFVEDPDGVMFRGKIRHRPWRLWQAHAHIDFNTVLSGRGIPAAAAPVSALCTRSMDTVLWPLQNVGAPRDLPVREVSPADPTLLTPWVMEQTERHALMSYWRVDPARVRALVPASLELDLRDGEAWVGMIALEMFDVTPRGLTWIDGADFAELDLFTFVRHEGGTGLYFFSIDAASTVAATAARLLFDVPYHASDATLTPEGDGFAFRAVRKRFGLFTEGEFSARYTPRGEAFFPPADTLPHWLVERYTLFVASGDCVRRGDVRHTPWPLREVTAHITVNTLPALAGLTLRPTPDVVYYSPGVRVRTWPVVPFG
jgi:uncharacterized protein YqjF (DUF2071 family)/uncharacterized protein with NAD-binding domain and iron-sulfur cluster